MLKRFKRQPHEEQPPEKKGPSLLARFASFWWTNAQVSTRVMIGVYSFLVLFVGGMLLATWLSFQVLTAGAGVVYSLVLVAQAYAGIALLSGAIGAMIAFPGLWMLHLHVTAKGIVERWVSPVNFFVQDEEGRPIRGEWVDPSLIWDEGGARRLVTTQWGLPMATHRVHTLLYSLSISEALDKEADREFFTTISAANWRGFIKTNAPLIVIGVCLIVLFIVWDSSRRAPGVIGA